VIPNDGQSARIDEALLRRVSVVIPTLNEVDCITHVLARIPTSVREIIVVDGLSIDGTADAAAAARPDVQVVHQQVRGKGAAIRAGIEVASGEYIVLMDGDGSTFGNPASYKSSVALRPRLAMGVPFRGHRTVNALRHARCQDGGRRTRPPWCEGPGSDGRSGSERLRLSLHVWPRWRTR
jgi:hypothetical protein